MKKIKGLLILGFFALFGIGSSFGDSVYSTSIIRTSIFTSNNADVKFIQSKNYYNPASFEYVNRNQSCRSIFNYHGFGIYSSFSNFEFNFNSGLNNYYYLIPSGNSYISSQYNLAGCSSANSSNPIYSDMSFFTFGYTNSIFNGTVSYNSKLTRWSSDSISDGLFAGTLQWNSDSSSNSSITSNGKYVHLYYEPGISDFSYNPGEINSSFPIKHYIYFDSNYIYSDYGNKRDIPEGFIRTKLFENLYSTYSSIAYDTSNSGLVFYSSYGPLQWSYNESNSSYNIYPSLSSGYLLLNFIDYESDTLTGNSTIVLSLSGDSIIYNYYNSYSPFIQQLDLNNPTSKGVLTYDGSSLSAYNRLVAFVYDLNGFYFDSFGSLQNGLTLRTYHRSSASSMYSDYTFLFESDNSIPVIIPGGGNGNQPSYSGSVSLGSDCVDTQICWDYTGSQGDIIKMCTTECVSPEVIESGSYVGSDGTIYYVDSNYDLSELSAGEIIFDTGFLDEDGFVSLDYYMTLFNSPSDFALGKCPYPPSTFLKFATKFKIGKIYPLMPLNCLASAFNQGFRIHYFDDFGLFPDLNSQLISGDTHFHKTLYRFFDVLLSLGLFIAISALLRIFKK